MNKKKFKRNVKEVYSSQEKRIMVEEIRSGLLSLRQSMEHRHVSGSVLQNWNRWYYRTRLLKYSRPKLSFLMVPSQTRVDALAERVNRTIKEEFNCRAFICFDLAKAAITKSILLTISSALLLLVIT